MSATDSNGHELKVGDLVRRMTVTQPEGARAWGGRSDYLGGERLGVVDHVVGHDVVTGKGVFCGRLVTVSESD